MQHRRTLSMVATAVGLTTAALLCGVRPAGPEPGPGADAAAFRVLVFSKTAGFRHDCIPAGIEMIRRLGLRHGFAVDATEDSGVFSSEGLSRYSAVIFLCTTGDVLNSGQEAAFESYIRAGGGFVGIHSAADTEYGWPFYGQLVGAYFASHPAPQSARIVISDRDHPSTAPLPDPWTRFDEWYNFRAAPGPAVRVLANLDESSYSGGTMGADHPIVWCHEELGGRAWYMGGGHTTSSYSEPLFERHVWGGISWTARLRHRAAAAGPARAASEEPR